MCGGFLNLRWPVIDLIPNFLAFFIPNDCIFPFICSQISAVTIDGFFIAGKQLRSHGHIMDIGGSDLHGMHQPSVLVHSNMRLVAEVIVLPLLRRMGFWVALFLAIFGT